MTYSEAKSLQARMNANYDAAVKTLRSVPGVGTGAMGLTPDSVKSTSEYRDARTAERIAFIKLQSVNKWFCKAFKSERAEENTYRSKATK